jgi:hypothetical protein
VIIIIVIITDNVTANTNISKGKIHYKTVAKSKRLKNIKKGG